MGRHPRPSIPTQHLAQKPLKTHYKIHYQPLLISRPNKIPQTLQPNNNLQIFQLKYNPPLKKLLEQNPKLINLRHRHRQRQRQRHRPPLTHLRLLAA